MLHTLEFNQEASVWGSVVYPEGNMKVAEAECLWLLRGLQCAAVVVRVLRVLAVRQNQPIVAALRRTCLHGEVEQTNIRARRVKVGLMVGAVVVRPWVVRTHEVAPRVANVGLFTDCVDVIF